MQIATITVVVKSTGKKFEANASDILDKVRAKLDAGDYTSDIEEDYQAQANQS